MTLKYFPQIRVGGYVHLDPFLKGGCIRPIYVTYCTYTVYVVWISTKEGLTGLSVSSARKKWEGGVNIFSVLCGNFQTRWQWINSRHDCVSFKK